MKKIVLCFFLTTCFSAFGQISPGFVPPSFEGNFTEWFKANVVFPWEGIRDKLTGQAEVSFKVQSNGQISDCAANGLPVYFCREALKGLQNLTMIPPTLNGEPAECEMKILLDFSLLSDSIARNGMTVVERYSDPAFVRGLGESLVSYRTWMDREFRVPESMKNHAFSGSVRMTFELDEMGKITDPRVECSNPEITAELERLLGECPAWESPAMVNGKAHAITVSDNVFCQINAGDKSERPFLITDRMPVFQGGGLDKLRSHVMPQLRYPPECAEFGITGTVVISFVIGKDGSISSFFALSNPDIRLTNEVIRVLKTAPKWTPGIKDGVPAEFECRLPIEFKIQN